MWFQVKDQPVFPVGLWQRTKDSNGLTLVTCDPNRLVEPIHTKAMIKILEPEGVDTCRAAAMMRWLRCSGHFRPTR
jgi:putative SOS response-associated peptidase YedK